MVDRKPKYKKIFVQNASTLLCIYICISVEREGDTIRVLDLDLEKDRKTDRVVVSVNDEHST